MAKKGLGKGLSALIPNEEKIPADEKNKILNLNIEAIHPNPHQPRKTFDQEALKDLSNSIKEHGILQPLVVYKKDNDYYLISGERRLRASQLAGLKLVPAILKDVNEESSSELAIIENIQRENLSPLEESRAYEQLMEDFSLTQNQVAKKVGKSRSYVANLLRLNQLPEKIQIYIEEGLLSSSHGRSILSVDEVYQEAFGIHIVKNQLSVREVEALAKDFDPDKVFGTQKVTKKAEKDVHLESVEKELENLFGTKVLIKGKSKGSIVLKYHSNDDLIRIVDQLMK